MVIVAELVQVCNHDCQKTSVQTNTNYSITGEKAIKTLTQNKKFHQAEHLCWIINLSQYKIFQFLI